MPETNLARLIEYFGKAKPLTDIDHNEAKKFSAWRRVGDPMRCLQGASDRRAGTVVNEDAVDVSEGAAATA